MLRPPLNRTGPICPRCGEEGIHPELDQCIAMLRVQIALVKDEHRRHAIDAMRRIPGDDSHKGAADGSPKGVA